MWHQTGQGREGVFEDEGFDLCGSHISKGAGTKLGLYLGGILACEVY